MVRGINSFRQWFYGYEEQQTIIGGTACDLLMTEEGLDDLICNDPIGQAALILNDDREEYLKNMTDYSHFGIWEPPVQTSCGVGVGGMFCYTE